MGLGPGHPVILPEATALEVLLGDFATSVGTGCRLWKACFRGEIAAR